MLQKRPKSQLLKKFSGVLKTLFVAETILFAGSYYVWYRMNTSRDFRLFMHNNYSWALDGYYSIGEYLSHNDLRKQDIDIWDRESKLSKKA